MKRTAATIVMLAGLGGCASPETAGDNQFGQASRGRDIPGVVGPLGEPLHVAAGQMPTGKESKVTRADHKAPAAKADSGVQQTAGFARINSGGGRSGVHMTGITGGGSGGAVDPNAYGPLASGAGMMMGHGGITPAPAMGPWGAVALAPGAGGMTGGMYGPMYANQRTSVRFAGMNGISITWQGPGGTFIEPAPLQSPARYNFPQGSIYRLRLSKIPTQPGKVYYPTLEVYPSTPKTVTFLSHTTVPVSFTEADFAQVNGGNLVIKVIYLPDPQFQELGALANIEELRSDPLEPGVNPVEEANRRGTILAVVRIGNIDLQDPNTPAMESPPGVVPGGPGMTAPPRLMPAPGGPKGPPVGGGAPKAPTTLPASAVSPMSR